MTIFPFNRGVRSAMGDHVDYVSVHSFLFHDCYAGWTLHLPPGVSRLAATTLPDLM